MTSNNLIARIEAATGPDRELDALIAAACRTGAEEWVWTSNYPAWIGRPDGRVEVERGGPSFEAPRFTASLDAAMTMVPDHLKDDWSLIGGSGWQAEVGYELADAATPALALVAACLKARSRAGGEHGSTSPEQNQ